MSPRENEISPGNPTRHVYKRTRESHIRVNDRRSQTSTYRHNILCQLLGKIRKNIRFGSTITNKSDNEALMVGFKIKSHCNTVFYFPWRMGKSAHMGTSGVYLSSYIDNNFVDLNSLKISPKT